MQGYLSKKPQLNRWIKRYYAYEEGAKRLSYWKTKKEYHAGQPCKGSFADSTLLRVYFPNKNNLSQFNLSYSDKELVLKAETSQEAKEWFDFMTKLVSSEGKSTTEIIYDEEEMQSWNEQDIVKMMHNGMRMTAYFQNNTCKQFKLFCRENTMYACPVAAGIERAIIQFPLRRISDIYVGKQTPGFDTDIAFPVPFENCFTIISQQYTLDVDAGSAMKANHWLNGIKYLLTESGKAVIINENEDEDEEDQLEDVESGAADTSEQATSQLADDPVEDVDGPQEDDAPMDTGVSYETRLRRTALVIVDVQKDYMPGGPVALPGADEIIPTINALRKRCTWDLVLLTQNWRPKDHSCFYETNKDNPEAKLGQALKVNGRLQIMWPVHCVANEPGAEFPDDLYLEDTDMVIQKATDADSDTLSCFKNQDQKKTSLEAVLAQHAIDDVFLVGVGYDTVITNTALEGQQIHYNVFVVEDACRAYHEKTKQVMTKKLKMGGVPIINTKDIPDDSLMSDELVQAARAEMALDDDADSGDEAARKQELSASVFAAAQPAVEASPTKSPSKKKGAKKGSKKGSKKGVRIVSGTKKTASGKTIAKGTRSAAARKKGAKKGVKKGTKKGSKKGSKKGVKKGSKKAASKKR
jgi:nicotinamidase/pyrazinamidase